MVEASWPLFEVFVRGKRGLNHVHVGSLHAADEQMALHHARDLYTRRQNEPYTEGKGSGLIFQDYDASGTAQYGFVVTSPTHDKNTPDLDAQTVVIPPESLGGGYDARIAGPKQAPAATTRVS